MADEQDRKDETPSILDKLIRFSLEKKLVVVLILIATIVAGIMTAPFDWDTGPLPRDPVPVDAIPDIGENQQIVFTRWMGRSPQDVEDQIGYPLTVALLGIPQIKTIRSYSMFGFSSIYVIFKEDAEFYWSRSRVLEKLNSLPAGTLPEGVQPMLGPDATALGQVFWYTLEGRDEEGKPTGGWDLGELRSIQDWTVRYHLLAADGVSEVASIGGFVKEYQVDVDPDAMRAYGVTLDQVFMAVKMSNVDVGARSIEVNKVEYVIRGLGLIESVEDVEDSVVAVNDNVPVYIKQIAHVSLGPALRRGALDKEGAEVVGGVVVVRYGSNPLAAIKAVKKKIAELAPGLPKKTLRDGRVSQVTVVPFYDRSGLIYETLGTLNSALTEEILVTIIVVLIMVVHLRSSILISGLLPIAVLMCFVAMKQFGVDANIVALSGIAIAIGTMVDMGIVICENILKHLDEAEPGENSLEVIYRASTEVASAVLTAVATTVVGFLPVFTMTAAEGKLFGPLAYTKTFALIASVIVAIFLIPPFAHVLLAGKIRRRTWRFVAHGLVVVGGIVMVFAITWWIGLLVMAIGGYHIAKEWIPKDIQKYVPWAATGIAAFTVLVILARHWTPLGPEKGAFRNFLFAGIVIGGLLGFFRLFQSYYGHMLKWFLRWKALFLLLPFLLVAALFYIWLGPATVIATVVAIGANGWAVSIYILLSLALLGGGLFLWLGLNIRPWNGPALLIGIPAALFLFAILVWTGALSGELPDGWKKKYRRVAYEKIPRRERGLGTYIKWVITNDWDGRAKEFMPPLDEGSYLYMPSTMPHASIGESLDALQKQDMLIKAIPEVDIVVGKIGRADTPLDPAPISMVETVVNYMPKYIVDRDGHRMSFRHEPGETEVFWNAIVDERGLSVSFPYEPEKTQLFRKKDAEPVRAPDGKPYRVRGRFVLDSRGGLIPDDGGKPFRLWRPALVPDPDLNPDRQPWKGIRKPDDIWDEIVAAAKIPGSTSAPRLQPIATRIVMLQSGMRAPMGVKVKITGQEDSIVLLKKIEKVGLDIERLLKQVPSIKPDTVNADRIVGKPYLLIDIDRKAIARYGIPLRKVQDVIEVAIGGRLITTTVEGRERYPVRVRYMRELRDSIEALDRIFVPGVGGVQIPLEQLTTIRYEAGPQVIKSEDTLLVGYVTFDMKPGHAEVDVVEEAKAYLSLQEEVFNTAYAEAVERAAKIGRELTDEEIATLPGLQRPKGVTYTFAGTYENQIRSEKTLMVVLPLALFIIFIILYFQFNSVVTTFLVFIGIGVAWAGGFVMLWLYGQPWFLDFSMFGVDMRELFQVHPINLSVAVWVGFLALFGIASDDGVVMATYLGQSFSRRKPRTIKAIREATLTAGLRRIRPCLMTTATTIIALIPVLTSTGRGADVMVPMAIPVFGGMVFEVITLFVVPVLYCMVEEIKVKLGIGRAPDDNPDSAPDISPESGPGEIAPETA